MPIAGSLILNTAALPSTVSAGKVALSTPDGVSLAIANPSFRGALSPNLISTCTVSGSPSLMLFTGIPQSGFNHLLLRGILRGTDASACVTSNFRFASPGYLPDAGANYGYSYMSCTNTTLDGGAGVAQVWADGPAIDSGNSTANAFTPVEIFIGNYLGPCYKYMSSLPSICVGAVSLATTVCYLLQSSWRNVGPIATIQIGEGAAYSNLAVGSYLELYGIN